MQERRQERDKGKRYKTACCTACGPGAAEASGEREGKRYKTACCTACGPGAAEASGEREGKTAC